MFEKILIAFEVFSSILCRSDCALAIYCSLEKQKKTDKSIKICYERSAKNDRLVWRIEQKFFSDYPQLSTIKADRNIPRIQNEPLSIPYFQYFQHLLDE